MQALLARQLADGAAGLSLGLVYPPSAYADAAELLALAETVQAHGKMLAAHIRSYEAGLARIDGRIHRHLAMRPERRACCRICSRRGDPTGARCRRRSTSWKQARRDGIDVSFDMYPYPAGSSYILQLLPPEAQEGGLPALLAQLRDPERPRGAAQGGGGRQLRPKCGAVQDRADRLGQCAHLRHQQSRSQALGRQDDGCRRRPRKGITPFDLMVR